MEKTREELTVQRRGDKKGDYEGPVETVYGENKGGRILPEGEGAVGGG